MPLSLPCFKPLLRIGVMASGNGTNFEALVTSIQQNKLKAEIPLLIVNNPDCEARKRAIRLGIPCKVINHKDYTSREELDTEIRNQFKAMDVEGIVMAGWMRIVTSNLINAYHLKIVNIHPSILPSFPGVDAVGQAIKAGVKISGCTVHLVTQNVDSGPILVQSAVMISPKENITTLKRKIQLEEHKILPIGVSIAGELWRII